MKRKTFLILQIPALLLSLLQLGANPIAAAEPANEASVDYLALVPDWYFDGDQSGAELGFSVDTAGDLDGDGFDDIVIGAPKFVPPDESTNYGAAFVFYGSSSSTPLESKPHQLLAIKNLYSKGSLFGSAVASAGDVNNDGYDDLLVGAPEYKVPFTNTNGTPPSGAIFLYLGSQDGINDTPDWSYEAEVSEIKLGFSVAAAGDVNNDTYADFLVGAPLYESSDELSNEGIVYLFFGSQDGPAAEPDWAFACGQAAASCGHSVGSAGDLNNDDYDDIVIGAPHYNNPEVDEGAAFVFLGAADGPASTYQRLLQSNQPEAEFGRSVAGAGNVNGDSFDDLIIGAPYFDQDALNPDDYGAAFVFLGSTGGVGTDYDVLLSIPELLQPAAGDRFGISVDSAGDVNQDGFADVLVGADYFGEENSANQKDEGAVFLYTGNPSGLNPSPDWFVSGNKAEAYFGFSAAPAGDVNGDGGVDIIVGAPNYRYDQKIVMGRAFVYLNTLEDFSNYYYHIFIPFTLSD